MKRYTRTNMAEYTRDIKQLTRDASTQPTFAPPSQSLAGDLVNLANTGLQFYAKNKAQDMLQEQMQAQTQQERTMSKGILDFRQMREEVRGQGLTRTQLLQKENQFLKQYPPEIQMAIISGTNKLTGQTTADITSSIDAEQKARQTARRDLEEEAVELTPFMNKPLDLNASDEEIRQLTLEATSRKAMAEKKKADATLRSTQLSNQGKQQDLDAERFAIDYGILASSAYAQQANALMDTADFNNPTQVQELLLQNDNLRKGIIQEGVRAARENGVVITPSKLEEMMGNELAIFDNVESFLKRDDIASMSANQRKFKVNNLVLGLQNSTDEDERDLGHVLLLIDSVGENNALTQEFMKMNVSSIIKGYGDKIYELGRETPTEMGLAAKKKTTEDTFKNADENVPQETRDAYTEVILSDLTGSEARRERVLSNGGFTAYVNGIATGKPEHLIVEDKKDEVLSAMMQTSKQFLRRAIPKILKEEQLLGFEERYDERGRLIRGKGPRPITKTGEESLNALGNDLKLSFPNPPLTIRNQMRKYNTFVDNIFTALDKLGATEEEKDFMRNEILLSFNKASTERQDTR